LTQQERILARRVVGVSVEVERIMKHWFGVKWFRLKKNDEIRLLRLKQWEEKYHVSLIWIMSQLLPFWRARHARYKKEQGLGVTVATFVGRVSEEFLRERIREQFPDGEPEKRWKVETQQSQWARIWDLPGRSYSTDPILAVKEYRKRIGLEREDRRRWASKLRKRRYRGNPW